MITNKQAITTLEDIKKYFEGKGDSQYTIPALDKAIKSVEKQIQMKVLNSSNRYSINLDRIAKTGICPHCEDTVDNTQRCCKFCGQRLDWVVIR